MRICIYSLRNKHFPTRCVYSNILNRKFPPKKPFRLALEIVFTRAAPAFDILFMGCVFNINTVHNIVEKLTFSSILLKFTIICKFVKEEVILTSTESFKGRALILPRLTAFLGFKSLMYLETKSSLIR